MYLRDAIKESARRASALALVAVLFLSVWICLIAGGVAMMRPALGLGGAFFVMAAILAATAVFVVWIGRLSTSSSRRAGIEAREARLAAAAASAVLSGLSNRKTLKFALIATSAIAAGVALLLSGQDAPDKH